MKTLRIVLLAAVLIVVVGFASPWLPTAAAIVVPPINVSLDESQSGWIQGFGGVPLPGAAILCEGTAGTNSCGTNPLSDLVVFGTPGTVSVVAGNNLPGTIGNQNIHTIINSFTTPGLTLLLSDVTTTDPANAFADALPTSSVSTVVSNIQNSNGANTPIVYLSEGAEDTNQVITYSPTCSEVSATSGLCISGQPGAVAGVTITYTITSDTAAVPDPASALLFGTGILGLPVLRRFSVGRALRGRGG